MATLSEFAPPLPQQKHKMNTKLINKCQVRAVQQGDVDGVCDFVRLAITCTPKQFEEARKQYPKCQIYHGGRCAWTVFGSAACYGNYVLLEYLLTTYGDIFSNIGNEFGMTPIFCATYGDTYTEKDDEACAQCIAILLRHGGDPTITTPDGTSPLQNCINGKKYPLMTALLRRVAPETETVAPATEENEAADSKKRKL
jgi:hypothetical protein